MFVYLIFLVIFLVIPLVVCWILFWKELIFYKKTLILTTMLTFLFGIPWDVLSVKTGLWRYDSSPTLNIWFFGNHATGLPLEELLFTFLCPILLVTVAIVFRNYKKRYV